MREHEDGRKAILVPRTEVAKNAETIPIYSPPTAPPKISSPLALHRHNFKDEKEFVFTPLLGGWVNHDGDCFKITPGPRREENVFFFR